MPIRWLLDKIKQYREDMRRLDEYQERINRLHERIEERQEQRDGAGEGDT